MFTRSFGNGHSLSQGPVSSQGGTVVVHWPNMWAFVVPLVHLPGMLMLAVWTNAEYFVNDEFDKGDAELFTCADE